MLIINFILILLKAKLKNLFLLNNKLKLKKLKNKKIN